MCCFRKTSRKKLSSTAPRALPAASLHPLVDHFPVFPTYWASGLLFHRAPFKRLHFSSGSRRFSFFRFSFVDCGCQLIPPHSLINPVSLCGPILIAVHIIVRIITNCSELKPVLESCKISSDVFLFPFSLIKIIGLGLVGVGTSPNERSCTVCYIYIRGNVHRRWASLPHRHSLFPQEPTAVLFVTHSVQHLDRCALNVRTRSYVT